MKIPKAVRKKVHNLVFTTGVSAVTWPLWFVVPKDPKLLLDELLYAAGWAGILVSTAIFLSIVADFVDAAYFDED